MKNRGTRKEFSGGSEDESHQLGAGTARKDDRVGWGEKKLRHGHTLPPRCKNTKFQSVA